MGESLSSDLVVTETDTSLQGSWAGKGIKRRRPNPKFLMLKPGMEPSERKDANRSNVIISEKKDKKASKFLVKDLPYPYTSTGQYEKTFETPLGGEWNSRAGYQRGTLPRVMKKVGTSSVFTSGACVDQFSFSLEQSSSRSGDCSDSIWSVGGGA